MTTPIRNALLVGATLVVIAVVLRLLFMTDRGRSAPSLLVRYRTVTETGYLTTVAITDSHGKVAGDVLLVTQLPANLRPFLVDGMAQLPEAGVLRFREVYHHYPRGADTFDSTQVVQDTVVISIDPYRHEIWIAPSNRLRFEAGGAYLLDLSPPDPRIRRIARP